MIQTLVSSRIHMGTCIT